MDGSGSGFRCAVHQRSACLDGGDGRPLFGCYSASAHEGTPGPRHFGVSVDSPTDTQRIAVTQSFGQVVLWHVLIGDRT